MLHKFKITYIQIFWRFSTIKNSLDVIRCMILVSIYQLDLINKEFPVHSIIVTKMKYDSD